MEENRIAIPEELKKLAEAYKSEGGRLYVVGGAVRNAFLGLPHSDVDITGALLQETVEEICRERGILCSRMSTELGTLHIRLGDQIYEYTPFRTEEYGSGGKHRPEKVLFGVSMLEDAERRDFTVNALYADAITGEISDPLEGLADLKNRVLRCCAEDTLESDALRILRLVRFSGELGFEIEENTYRLAKKNAAKIQDIAQERIWEELSKILLSDVKYGEPYTNTHADMQKESESVYKCLKQMEGIGITAILFPELLEGEGIAQRSDYHRYTILEHAYHSCASAVPELTLRLAGLFHDVGKPFCMKQTGNYHMHMLYGERIAGDILTRCRIPNRLKKDVLFLIRNHMYDIQNTAKEKSRRKRFAEWGRQNTRNLILIREADIRGSGTRPEYRAEEWRKLYEKMLGDGTPFSVRDLKIGGNTVLRELNVQEGKTVGDILELLRETCVLHPGYNTKEKLIQLLHTKEILKKQN